MAKSPQKPTGDATSSAFGSLTTGPTPEPQTPEPVPPVAPMPEPEWPASTVPPAVEPVPPPSSEVELRGPPRPLFGGMVPGDESSTLPIKTLASLPTLWAVSTDRQPTLVVMAADEAAARQRYADILGVRWFGNPVTIQPATAGAVESVWPPKG